MTVQDIKLKHQRGRRETVVGSRTFWIDFERGEYCVSAPRGSDWTTAERFDLRVKKVLGRVDEGALSLTFESADDLKEFNDWLVEANKIAEKSIETMY